MRPKRLLSACLALALCLSLLPVTALAAGEDAPGKLWVDQTQITGSGYWKTTTEGKLEPGRESDYNVYYDGNGTLTLNNAKIQGRGYSGNPQPEDYGIYAAPTGNQSVSLTINLMGSNTVSGYCGICVETTTADNASLVIQPAENDPQGSLEAIGNKYNGITISSGSGNASLTINNAPVVAISKSPTPNSYHGVCIKTGNATAPALSLLVNGGSLTAQGQSGYGIYFYMGNSTTDPSTSLTIQNNALVKATPSIFTSNNLSKPDTTAGSESGGIVFDGKNGTVYGDVELQDDLTINEGETLTIGKDASLTVPDGKTLTNNGTINVESGGKLEGTTTGNGTLKIAPTITTQPQDVEVKENETATFNVKVTGTEPLSYQWQQSTDNGQSWTNITGETNATYTIATTTMDMSGYQYRCVVTSASGVSVTSDAATLTVNEPTTYAITANADPSEGGTVTGNGDYADGSSVTLKATASSGYRFVGWMENGKQVSADATYTFTANSSHTFTAQFEKVYTVRVNASGGGTATGGGSYAEGDTVTLTATPDSGYHFTGWTSSDGVTFANASSESTTFTMPAGDVTVRAVFSPVVNIPDTHEIELIVGDGGEAKLSLTNASAGSTITVTATPDEGYELAYITVDGERISGTTFKMPDHDVTVRVYFTDGSATLPFTDVSAGAWYLDAVSYVYANGLMDGTSGTTFEPDANMTRAMVWAILARVDGETVTGTNWIETAREWAMAEGVSDGENASGYVTREQLATMLYRYAVYKGYDVSIGEDTNILSYADFADLSEYAIPAMQWACGAGIVNGTSESTLTPQGEATRAQVAAMLMRFVEAIG